MAEIPQLQDTQPILQAQTPSTKSTGYDALAKVLGEIAKEAGKQAGEIEKEHSKSMMVNSVANVEQLKTSAQMQLLEHPDQAVQVSQNMQKATDMVKQAAFVNEGDRAKLNYYSSIANDSVALMATKSAVHQSQLMAEYTHYGNWIAQVKVHDELLMKDPEAADKYRAAMIGSLKNLVQTGVITPHAAAAQIKSLSERVDVQREWVQRFKDGDVSAEEYHRMHSSLLPKSQQEIAASPVNESTAWMVNTHNSDRSFQGALSDVYKHLTPNLQTYYNMEPSQRDHIALAMEGVKVADGLINSGTPLPTIQNVYDDLNQKNRVLNYKETGLRNSIGQYLHRINTGDYLGAIESTPGGAAILHDYTNRNIAISNSAMSNEDKTKYTLDNMNNMVNGAIAYGYGHHFTPTQIQPIPKSIVANMEQAFKVGQDPSIILQTIGQFREENRPWLGNAMKKPSQKVVVNTVSLAGNFSKPTDLLEYIASNQDGRTFQNVEANQEGGVYGQPGTKQDKIKHTDPILSGLLVSQTSFQNAMAVVRSQYDQINTQQIQDQLVKTSLNYVKYMAEQKGDFSMQNRDEYIQRASSLIANAYPKISGTNYIANPRQLNLTPAEMDVLAVYAIDQGQNYLKAGFKESVYETAFDRNRLKMTLSPTNEVMAVDGNNVVYWHAPFSANLMGAATSHDRKQRADAEKLQKEIMSMRYGAGGIP